MKRYANANALCNYELRIKNPILNAQTTSVQCTPYWYD